MNTLFKELLNTVWELEHDFDKIPESRQSLLKDLTTYIRNRRNDNDIRLIFICTHNSRRSHIAQIWAQTAAYHYEIKKIHCFSGGTEVSVFHPNAVKALEKAGFRIKKKSSGDNPVYSVYFCNEQIPVTAFSKLYSNSFNPQSEFVAVMTCSAANESCPFVSGSIFRIPLTYEDPKIFDQTVEADQRYFDKVREIGREMLFVFSGI